LKTLLYHHPCRRTLESWISVKEEKSANIFNIFSEFRKSR
jgi:hypothetical protein